MSNAVFVQTDEQESPLVLARVVYDYEPRDTNEIALETGALINVLHMANEHWWCGAVVSDLCVLVVLMYHV